MYRLKNTVRDYAWGSTSLMADYLGLTPTGRPEAEMWLGAHAGSPSIALTGSGDTRLDELIAAEPEATLGAACRKAFGDQLPFLMKMLAAGSPLSLQVHPTQEQAAAGFAAEEDSGVPLTATQRNYKDPNHKPEMIVALTDFEALCGFRPAAQTAAIFDGLAALCTTSAIPVPEVIDQIRTTLRGHDEHTAIKSAFSQLIRGGPSVTEDVRATAEVIATGVPEGPFVSALKTAHQLNDAYPSDPGVLISLMLNRVSLRPGESVYLPAGNTHAYLHGLGIEVMASSDNVLRGGLTTKYIDVDELMRTVDFTPLPVPRLEPDSPRNGHRVWSPPVDEFQLHRIELQPGADSIDLPDGTPAVILVVAGTSTLHTAQASMVLGAGDSAFLTASEQSVSMTAASDEPVVAFLTTSGPPCSTGPLAAM
ncbi:mannose-6-phosphate isomerase, class I (plasmid) [Arthrobacter sp. StoSoilB3]|nr:mannose-6-phosphate isomerase, class I [Arthrobacter sp. StoSoilB3]